MSSMRSRRAFLKAAGAAAGGLVVRGSAEAASVVAIVVDPSGPVARAILGAVTPVTQRPANPIRSVTRNFMSEPEDKPWFYDREFWQRYLTMLVTQRFNRFSLALGLGYNSPRNVTDSYFYFPY